MFTTKDKIQIAQRGSDVASIKTQLEYFKKGFPFIHLIRPATPDDGIQVLDEKTKTRLVEKYETKSGNLNISKFVPASGAASRMFKDLFTFLEDDVKPEDMLPIKVFIERIQDFAFYNTLAESLSKKGSNIEELIRDKQYKKIIGELLEETGLSYGSLPKGLLEFHSYPDGTRTPLEEHLTEGALIARGKNNEVRLHFTVSPDHMEKFKQHVKEVKLKYETQYDVNYIIDFSIQKPHTDTIAVDPGNQPFRETTGSLLFRPAGHGALIENLNEIDAEIIFIKNIDNVVPDHLKGNTTFYKMVLAGKLIELNIAIDQYLRLLETGKETYEDKLPEIRKFIQKELCIRHPQKFENQKEEIDFLIQKLNRPLRVCGMVKNEGEPGGGPFYALNPDQTISLQIAESAQINPSDPKQQAIAENATHFNPVDLVCRVKDYKGNKFQLPDFIDPQTGFISGKSKDGRELKAMELPGLWNGAMSDWNTVFVEVPVSTFNPVKTVNDLLRPQHQAAQ